MTKLPESNSVYWDEASDLLQQNWLLRLFPTESAKTFHVAFEDGAGTTKLVIDKKAPKVAPAGIEATDIFYMAATYSEATEVTSRAMKHTNDSRNKVAAIEMVEPKPNIQWTLTVDGTTLKGERNKPQRFMTLGAAMETAALSSATEVSMVISRAARDYFKARRRRSEWINQVLAAQNSNLKTWCLDNGHDYTTVFRVMNRGDDIPEVKALLSELANKSIKTLWPTINWKSPDHT